MSGGPRKDEASGPRRFGKYLLLRRVAVGGMAEIHLALEETPHAGRRFVTIKRIRSDLASDPDFIDFFKSEGQVSLKCSHPNLPQAYDLGIVEGTHYLAMEYIRGHTLLDVIRTCYGAGEPFSVSSAVHVGIQVAAALEHAHSLRDVDGKPLRVIHRDVTPQNIMVSATGTVKLIDFGIVRSSRQFHETQAGTIKGKFSYMAPEQLAGPHRIDQRCDIFALGVCLHESLTGRSLFRGRDDAATIRRVRSGQVPNLAAQRPDVPIQLQTVIAKALERRPRRRFQSATELLAALESVAEECNIHHSVTKIRDEVLAHCGDPPMPTLDPDAISLLTTHIQESESDIRAATEAEPQPPALSSSVTTERVEVAEGSVASPVFGIAGDRDLVYYLRKAGFNVPESLRRRGSTDPELEALLQRSEN